MFKRSKIYQFNVGHETGDLIDTVWLTQEISGRLVITRELTGLDIEKYDLEVDPDSWIIIKPEDRFEFLKTILTSLMTSTKDNDLNFDKLIELLAENEVNFVDGRGDLLLKEKD